MTIAAKISLRESLSNNVQSFTQRSSFDVHCEIELNQNRSEAFENPLRKAMMRKSGHGQSHDREQRQKVKGNDNVADDVPERRRAVDE